MILDIIREICNKYYTCSEGCPLKTENGYICNKADHPTEELLLILSSLGYNFKDQIDIVEEDIENILNK